MGKSQIDVARIATETFKEYEIDAVFLEQPDTLKVDWSPYERLKGSKDAPIAALQQRMLNEWTRVDTTKTD